MSQFKLRDYQQDLRDRYHQAAESHRSIMLQLATGGGKTILFSFVIQEAIAKNWKCLVLAHRIELILQAVDKIEAITNEPVGIIKAGYPQQYDRPIQVASVQSMVRRLNDCPKFDLIVVDESHHATAKTYKTILDYFPNARILGVSATPIRLDGKGFRDTFSELLTGVTTKELMSQGSLSTYKYFATDTAMSLVGVGKQKGDYKVADLERANPIASLAADIVKAYRDYAPGKQAVIFCVSVEYSIATAAHFNAAGIQAAHLDGKSNDVDRAETMGAFRAGRIQVLSNYALLDEGVDIAGIEAVILARPTASLSRQLQMVGRALRPAEHKEHALIIDLADNYLRHGFPCDDRAWSLDGVKPKLRQETKLVRNPESGEVEELVIDLTPTARRIVEVSSTKFSAESLGQWQGIVDVMHDRMEREERWRNWCWEQLMSSPTKPPLIAWEYLGHKLGYHHGWAFYKVKEWVEPLSGKDAPIVTAPPSVY